MKIDFIEQQQYNRRKTWFIVILFTGLLVVLGYALDRYQLRAGFPYLTLLALALGSLNSFIAYYQGDKLILSTLGARTAREGDLKEKQYRNVVAEMSVAAGIPMPKIWIFNEASPNAFATGRDERHASVCVTTGLLETMNREELQGVIGHEIGHIRQRDILTMMMVSALVGAIVLLADWGRRMFYFSRREGEDRKEQKDGGMIVLIFVFALMVTAPILAQLMAMARSRTREYMADAASVEFTRNPLALASALTKIASHYDRVVDKATDGTAHLFIAAPKGKAIASKEGFWANLLSTHPPIWRRIKNLEEMGGIRVEAGNRN